MSIDIIVPRLGWSMEEGTFAGWLKNPGEKVSAGEPLFALESDKVTMEVEALDSGVLTVLPDAPETGGTVVVGQKLGYLLAEGEAAPSPSAPAAPVQAAVAPPAPEPARSVAPAANGRRPVSPRARAAAKTLGIDLSQVAPAPGAKRVVEADVRRAYEKLSAAKPAPVSAPSTPTSRVRKIIAQRLEESFRTPHFYVHAEVDAAFLDTVRQEMLPIVEEQCGVRLTYNDLLIRAIALALRASPDVNCYWSSGDVVARAEVNVGLAAQVNDALLVPVIRNADRLTLAQVAAARHSLIEKCRAGEAKPADFEDGSVTISNLGAFGVDRFQAILNPPQSAIIAVGSVAKRPFVDGDAVVARLTMPVSVSVDHRVVDGVAAAKFLGAIVKLLQSPLRLLV